jgi:hypothetical protein
MKAAIYCIIMMIICAKSSAQSLGPFNISKARKVCFTENAGQIKDQYGCVRDDIDYVIYATEGLTIFVGKGKISYQFAKPLFSKSHTKFLDKDVKNHNTGYDMYRLDMVCVDANINAKVIANEELPYFEQYYTSFFTGKLKCYNKVTYSNIYNGIDWVLYIKDGKLEYDYIVHPNGDVKDIKAEYRGATKLIKGNGKITVFSPLGKITERIIDCYTIPDKKQISCDFLSADSLLGYTVNDYAGSLIIDPIIDWATYFGGELNDSWGKITVDNNGYLYVSGSTRSISAIATTGAHSITHHGGTEDVFVAKFTTGGNRVWCTYFGGSEDDVCSSNSVLDSTGSLYITGYTNSSDSFATTGAHQTIYRGGGDGFVAKFDTGGTLIWSTYFGGTGSEDFNDITSDRLGNIYVSGASTSATEIATTGVYDRFLSGAMDAILVKFSSSGALIWATYFGGSNIENAYSVKCDLAGNVYIGGSTRSPDSVATLGAYSTSLNVTGISDDFLAKFRSNGNILWSTYFGGNGAESGVFGLDCDTSMNVYITGNTSSTSGIATSGTHQFAFGGGGTDCYLSKFSSNGNIQWSTYYGGTGSDYPNDLICDKSGKVLIAGHTNSNNAIATPTAVKPYISTGLSNYDAFLSVFTESGTLNWATYFGSAMHDYAYSIAVDDSNSYYLSGSTGSTDSIATSGAYQNIFGGGVTDCFIVKYRPEIVAVPEDTIDNHPLDFSEYNFVNEIVVLPNPVTKLLSVKCNYTHNNNLRIVFVDMLGRVVLNNQLSSGNNTTIIDLSIYKSGIYCYKIYDSDILIKSGRFLKSE